MGLRACFPGALSKVANICGSLCNWKSVHPIWNSLSELWCGQAGPPGESHGTPILCGNQSWTFSMLLARPGSTVLNKPAALILGGDDTRS